MEGPGASKLCTCVTADNAGAAQKLIEQTRSVSQVVEVRLDFWKTLNGLETLLGWIFANTELEVILTIRARRDGGQWPDEDEKARLKVLGEVIALLGTSNREIPIQRIWIDIEDWSPLLSKMEACISRAASFGLGIIRSFHDFSGVPGDLVARMTTLETATREMGVDRLMVKAAVMPKNLADTAEIFQAGRLLGTGGVSCPYILLGMGEEGFSTRVLSARIGSSLSFASPVVAGGEAAAPGQIDPHELESVYGFSGLRGSEDVFGIIGSPIGHSKSPEYHNRQFREHGIPGVYLPFLVNDLEDFFILAETLTIRGLSVTVPHKQTIFPYLDSMDESVQAIGACNTILREPRGWRGTNTDAPGFLAPIASRLDRNVGSALVVGAGGAARACVYALVTRGISVHIVNRTRRRAEELVKTLKAYVPRGTELAITDEPEGLEAQLVVQTTSLGMSPRINEDPLPGYAFRKGQVVYDIIYSPAKTRFLQRAEKAGCEVINGWPMFIGQAAIQSRLFMNQLSGNR
ncbi:shikimate dehydrogenase [Spirochaeta lutea]|uniref:Shikimate dehydrogenase (NADP(+)) n=1 Tax=Spirochaeta lutea TaxID=1480694 RepID=A0A098R3R3_9SPIO|nr:shikimate dehydrogenase [Spirochaeta lutea]KGE73332.1 hypothetical protein DC28_04170 [Spirochaeta lutea]